MWTDSCRWARQRLPLLAGGELAGFDRRRVERHLIGCSGCRGNLESLRGPLGVLRAVAAGPALTLEAASLWPALARQIRESRRPRSSFWSARDLRPAWLGAGLAAGLLMAAGTLASRAGLPLPARKLAGTAHPAPRRPPAPAAPALTARPPKQSPTVADAGTAGRSEAELVAQAAPPAGGPPPRNASKPPASSLSLPPEPTR